MTSRHNTHIPNRGDKVWVEKRQGTERQPNGYVRQIFWSDRQIEVCYYDSKPQDVLELFDFEEFKYSFSDYFGGIWMIWER